MALSLDEGGLSWMRPVKEPRERGTVMAPPAAPAGDESVWRPGSGFRNTGAFRERAMQGAQMAARGTEMGEPTSYEGGAGAPEPIAVMRGGATTFSPGRIPGRQFVEPEMATPTQAQQAWNRGTGVGEFRALGTSLAETKGEQERATRAAENLRPDLVAAAKIAEEKQAQAVKEKVGTEFEGRALKRWGTYKDGKPARPAEEHILRDLDEAKEYAMEQGKPQAGHQYMEWSQRLREMYPDVYVATMKANPLAWRDIVVTHGPNIPATTTTKPAPERGFGEPVTSGLSPFSVGP